MDEQNFLTEQFQSHREHLRAVGYRMLGSDADADDAVQETWLRLNRSEVGEVANLAGWLTTVMSRVCLDMLRSRRSRAEQSLDDEHAHSDRLQGANTVRSSPADPEREALLADHVGAAMLVVLDTLSPAERLAFVLHDMFAVSFDEIAAVLDRSPAATRQLASRARRRVQGATAPEAELDARRRVVDAFLAAAREGRFEDLLDVLAPDVVLTADANAVTSARAAAGLGAPPFERETIGARAVAEIFNGRAKAAQPALVDAVPGAAFAPGGRPYSVFAFVIEDGKVAQIDVITEPEQLAELDVTLTPAGGCDGRA